MSYGYPEKSPKGQFPSLKILANFSAVILNAVLGNQPVASTSGYCQLFLKMLFWGGGGAEGGGAEGGGEKSNMISNHVIGMQFVWHTFVYSVPPPR